MNLNKFYDFKKVLNNIRKYHTKIEHFYKHILFSIIYLPQMQKLNPNKYYEQEINMIIFCKN
jgi:hypothetical protein